MALAAEPLALRARIACERCAADSNVVVLDGYDSDRPVYRHYCLGCAEAADLEQLSHEQPRPFRPHLRAWGLVMSGLSLGVLATLADPLRAASSIGFGVFQQAGLVAAAVCVALGVLIRIVPLALAGAAVFVLMALFDLVFGALGPGWGWRQGICLILAAVLVVAGIWTRVRQGGWPALSQPGSRS